MAIKFEQVTDGSFALDVRGYSCPHPQMYTKKAMQKLQSGNTLKLMFDNASSGESILAMCEAEGNDIVSRDDGDGTFTWTIRKG